MASEGVDVFKIGKGIVLPVALVVFVCGRYGTVLKLEMASVIDTVPYQK
jgi:hypothetical protein